MPSSGRECAGNGNKGIFISFVIVPMTITLKCHTVVVNRVMDG